MTWCGKGHLPCVNFSWGERTRPICIPAMWSNRIWSPKSPCHHQILRVKSYADTQCRWTKQILKRVLHYSFHDPYEWHTYLLLPHQGQSMESPLAKAAEHLGHGIYWVLELAPRRRANREETKRACVCGVRECEGGIHLIWHTDTHYVHSDYTAEERKNWGYRVSILLPGKVGLCVQISHESWFPHKYG